MFAIVIEEGERLNLGAIKGGAPVNLHHYFFDAASNATDVTSEAVWTAAPDTVASFDEPVNFPGRLFLHSPGDINISAACQNYAPEEIQVHINGPS